MQSVLSAFVFGLLTLCSYAATDAPDYTTEDVFVPTQCDSFAKPGDHLLLEYSIYLANGTVTSSLKSPSQLYHILLEKSVSPPTQSLNHVNGCAF
jgi:hypothetical protein